MAKILVIDHGITYIDNIMKRFTLLEKILSPCPKSDLVLLPVNLPHEGEMSMECFNAILEYAGNPKYIIVSNDFVYEHLPSEGEPKDIHMDNGVLETWVINGVTIFYMPLGHLSKDECWDWHNILKEILV